MRQGGRPRQITARSGGYIERLVALARNEPDAGQRDGYLAAAHPGRGVETAHIWEMLARSRGFVQRWACTYRDGGIDALREKNCPGRAPTLARQREAELRARLGAGPRPEDKVCTLRGKDVQRILKQEFGVKHTLDEIHPLRKRLSYSCLAPRPRHERQDPPAQQRFREEFAPSWSPP